MALAGKLPTFTADIYQDWIGLPSLMTCCVTYWMAQRCRDVSAFPAGWVLLGLMTALVLTSWWPVRRLLFNFFYQSHWILFLLSAVMAAVHGAAPVLAGAGLWAADVLIRAVYMAGGQRPWLPGERGQ